ncbi:MAG: hypothetical protein ACKV2U_07890 [Bryobacteraceae bacterium]
MASLAQILANQANAQESTGPRTTAGKARSAANSTTHGFTTGYLVIAETEKEAYVEFNSSLDDALLPEGALELATFQQIVDSAWRLRKLHTLHAELAEAHQLDPLIVPACAPALKQLARYRAAVETAFYRAMKTFGELQTRRAARGRHLHEVEKTELPPELEPSVYAKSEWSTGDREKYLLMHGRIGPRQIWDLEVDECHQAVWVRRPDTEPPGPRPAKTAIHQIEPN